MHFPIYEPSFGNNYYIAATELPTVLTLLLLNTRDGAGILASHCPLQPVLPHLYHTKTQFPSQSLSISVILSPHSGQIC